MNSSDFKLAGLKEEHWIVQVCETELSFLLLAL